MENLVGLRPSFWNGRRLLITGHSGFKGSWLSLLARRLGAEVTGIALPPETEPNLFSLVALGDRVKSSWVDVRDPASVCSAVHESQPDIVIHMAAQPLVGRSYVEPLRTFAVNVMGTVNVLEAVRKELSVKAVVVVTSDKCYDNRSPQVAYREGDALGGLDPYSSSKACAELATAAWRGLLAGAGACCALGSARAGNVIGGGDWSEGRLIPDCVRAFSAGRVVDVRNPASIRPWQYVLDALTGYLLLAERLCESPDEYAGAWNFGPALQEIHTVAEVVEHAAGHWGRGAAWQRTGASGGLEEATALRLDATKANRLLGWLPRISFECAVRRTVEWYRRLSDGADAASLCTEQIDLYFSGEREAA